MADISAVPLQNYGQLLSSFGEGLANQENANTNAFSSKANAMQIPSEIAARNAGTQLTQAQTTGVGIANQRSQLQMQYYAHLLDSMQQPAVNDQAPTQTQASQDAASDQSATSIGTQSRPMANADGFVAGDDDTTIQDTGLDRAHIDNSAQAQFAVRNTYTPQEIQQLQLAMASGVPGAADTVAKLHDARIQNATARAQLDASRVYNNAAAIATAPDGSAFAALKQLSPNKQVPAQFEAMAKTKGWSADDLDEHVRIYAQEVANASHRFSGRDVVVGRDGIARDSQTNQPLLGGVPEGMDAKSYQDAYKSATELVDVKNSDGSESQVPRWRASGATSATQFINAQNDSGALPTTGIPKQFLQPPQQGGATQQPQQVQDPVLRAALADPSYKVPNQPVVSRQTPSLEQEKLIPARTQAGIDLSKDSGAATTAAATSLQYLQAAKSIMDSRGATVGAYGGLINAASKYLPFGNTDATNYAEVAKYLGNAALAQAKGTFPNLTQSEVGLQLNELSPSVHMTDKAISNLLNTNIAASRYAIDSAQRARQFLASHGDPLQFPQWQEKYFPRAQTINGNSQTNAPSVGTTRGGYRFKGGDPSQKSNWVKQ